ncbi:hypothetical protein FVEG_06985 [Fusarium verticillioides 7600]|uniref:Uncharacterized protein n=1 Tax=Gibberella moniliformis (strain M3125 / FGSC 7600) TaxID=334819 RepID=W7M4N3_GIBM7|nr:hypothetical protein FVEG_06985 [Fusarium verticillioides 7600]EWG46528.1 hypothetical protein FVEG_06985 [Fusarium verticillioides 7600]
MESRHWDRCWRCAKHLDGKPKWRASNNHKLFCDDCAELKLQGIPKTKQFAWKECVVCTEAIPDHYYSCSTVRPATGGPPFFQGHALCSRCAYGSRQRRLNLKRGFIDKCPMCRKKPRNPVRVVACTVIEFPKDKAAVPVDEPAQSVPVDEPAQPVPVDEPAQPVRVLGVRLGRSLNHRQVRVRWEDTWERHDQMGADKCMQVKGIVGETPESIKIRWKDTWELLEDLEDGPLKEEAKRLLEDKYSV